MNITLHEYISKSDQIHNMITNNIDFLSTKDMNGKLNILEEYINQIQTVSYRIAKIYEICKKASSKKIIIFKQHQNDQAEHDQPPEINTHITLKNHFSQLLIPPPGFEKKPILSQSILDAYSNGKYRNITPDIHIYAHELESLDEIPNTNIYWISSINQFAVRINGVLFRGDIGNIFNKNDQNQIGIEKCCHGKNCKNLKTKHGCKFYHDPFDLLMNGLLDTSDEKTKICSKYRNWSNSSWIYTSDFIKPSNLNMRHIGNRATLNEDLILLKKSIKYKDSIDKYQSQIMHDILVVLATHSNFKNYA